MRSFYSIVPVILTTFIIHGCSSVSYQGNYDTRPTSGYSYVPIDPIPVKYSLLANQDVSLIDYLPDNAVRMSIERIDAKGDVQFGVGGLAMNGDSLGVTIDYIMADTISVPMFIVTQRFSEHIQMGNSELTMNDAGFKVLGAHRINKIGELDAQRNGLEKIYSIRVGEGNDAFMVGGTKVARTSRITVDEYNIPIYIGVGLRITANVQVHGAKVNVSGIGSIGAEADANRLNGSMTIQTLGVNGRSISAALPIQSELNRTTVTSAIVAVGSIKALLYERETQIAPRVVGLYLPLSGDQELVNVIISAISSEEVSWDPKSHVEVNRPKGG